MTVLVKMTVIYNKNLISATVHRLLRTQTTNNTAQYIEICIAIHKTKAKIVGNFNCLYVVDWGFLT